MIKKHTHAPRHAKEAQGVCISCEGKTRGAPVHDDYVIKAIRAVKKQFKAEAGNKLVVCGKCLPEHIKKRGKFETTLLMYGGVGLLILIALLIVNLSLNSLLAGLVLLVFLLALAHINYVPKTEV